MALLSKWMVGKAGTSKTASEQDVDACNGICLTEVVFITSASLDAGSTDLVRQSREI